MNANASIRHRRVVRRRLWLITLCIFLPLIEIAVLQGVDFEQVMGLAPQVSAVPPFGLFHDLRWLYVYHASWGAFCGEWVGMIVARTVITMLLVRAAWPLRQAPPRWHVLLGQVLAFNTIAFLLLSPVVVLMFATSASGLAWPWYTAMVTVGEFSMLMPVWAIVGWSRLPNWQTIVLLVVVWLILAFVGGAIGARRRECLRLVVAHADPRHYRAPVAVSAPAGDRKPCDLRRPARDPSHDHRALIEGDTAGA